MKKPSQHELVKLYYRIGEVSQIVGVQPHVLRYWESEFRTIRPQKSNKGQRVYSRRDVEKLLRVKDLLKNQGFTIAGARKQLSTKSGVSDPLGSAAPSTAGLSVAPAASPADPSTPVGGSAPIAPVSAKGLRRALVSLRAEMCEMLVELQREDGRPDS